MKARQMQEAGIAPHDPKAEKRKPSTVCSICKQTFTVTAKGIEIKTHVDNKHPKESIAKCFPDVAGQIES